MSHSLIKLLRAVQSHTAMSNTNAKDSPPHTEKIIIDQ